MLMNECRCIKSYCSIIKTGGNHHYMLYLDFSNITVLSQKFNNSALVWFKQKVDQMFWMTVVGF